jgi:hypothetical protein
MYSIGKFGYKRGNLPRLNAESWLLKTLFALQRPWLPHNVDWVLSVRYARYFNIMYLIKKTCAKMGSLGEVAFKNRDSMGFSTDQLVPRMGDKSNVHAVLPSL